MAPWAHAQTVLVMGDSLSAAYNMPVEKGWVSLLERRLAKSYGPGWTVINGSISGETTSGGLTRLPAALARHNPDLVLIELGANDGLRGLQIAAMRANLNRMIALSKESGAAVGLIGVDLPGNYGQAFRQRFERVYAQIAAENSVPLLPNLLTPLMTKIENFQEDMLHPTPMAQAQILENLWPWLQPQVQAMVEVSAADQ